MLVSPCEDAVVCGYCLQVPTLIQHLDLMELSKLNVLHWHITDAQSFPLEVPALEALTAEVKAGC